MSNGAKSSGDCEPGQLSYAAWTSRGGAKATVVNVQNRELAGVSGFEPELQGFGGPPTAVILHPCN